MADDNETEFDFLPNIKLLLGITDDNSDEILQLYISIMEREILNYCNIRELPPALNYTLCQMVADLYNDNRKNTSGKIVGNVSSVSEDGRTVSFTSGTELKTAIEDRITRTDELKRYRKLFRV